MSSVVSDEKTKIELLLEAKYYQLKGLIDLIEREEKLFKDTTLLSMEHQKLLNKWCNTPNQVWKLIYKVIYSSLLIIISREVFTGSVQKTSTTVVILRDKI